MPKKTCAKKKLRKLTRTQRRKILFSSDGPDAIDFEIRRVSSTRHDVTPRRREDKKLFERLSINQQQAYELIQLGRNYSRFGIPVPRMRFTDAPGGYDPTLDEDQETIRKNYLKWRKEISHRFPGPVYAVMAYLDGLTIRKIESKLRISRYTGADFIAKGLTEYCLIAGLRDPRPPRPGYWGVSKQVYEEVIQDYFDNGLKVVDLIHGKKGIDTACPQNAQ